MRQYVHYWSRNTAWNAFIHELATWVIEQGIVVQQIPAPTFEEQERAVHVVKQFEAFGLKDTSIDPQLNAYGRLAGRNKGVKALMVVAHTDTVFSRETPLTLRRESNLIYGVGLGDNSLGVSGMLGLLKFLHDNHLQPECDIWFVATSCEEGLGDLKGMREAYHRLADEVGAVINLEGLAYGHVYHAGIAVHRLKITATTAGGHSWLHFGRPSAVHTLLQLGADFTRLHLPKIPRTTLNVGTIHGGQTVNAIATEAELLLDMRSETQEELNKLVNSVNQLIKSYHKDGVTLSVEVVSKRPAGYLSPSHALVQGALTVLEELGVSGTLEKGSTDGNIPLEAGCPCVTIGITRGGNAHRLDEYVDVSHVANGLRQLITLTLATTQFLVKNAHIMRS